MENVYVEDAYPMTSSYVENFAVAVEETYPMSSLLEENFSNEVYPITSSYAENLAVNVEEALPITSSYVGNFPVSVDGAYSMMPLYAENLPVAVGEAHPKTSSYVENFAASIEPTYPMTMSHVEYFFNKAYPMTSPYAENFPVAVEEPYPMTSLYVGNLHPNVTEDDLLKKFSPVGDIDSVIVCRNSITLDSLGYAYVNFLQQSDAEIAIDTLNYDYLEGLPMRIMWSRRDPSLRKSGVANVFIKNLHKNIDNNLLHDTFSVFGNILSCKVEMDNTNKSKGYGFIQFETEESAKIAIEQVNGKELNGKKVYVGSFIPRHKRTQSEIYFTNIFVKNFGEETSEQQLREIFEKIGTVTSIKIKMDHDGKSQGCGFVSFDNMESAKKAITELHDKEVIGGKILQVSRAKLKAELEQNRQECIERFQRCNVLIRHLDNNVTDECVREKFQQFGTITSTKVVLDGNGRSRCYGFVRFSSPEEASEAVKTMDNHVVWSKPLSVTIAKSKENWLKYKHAQQLQRSAFLKTQASRADATEFYEQNSNDLQDLDLNGAESSSHCPTELSHTAVNSGTPENLTTASKNRKSNRKNKINKNTQPRRRLFLSDFIVPEGSSNSR